MSDELTVIGDPVAAVRAKPSIFLGGDPTPERAMTAIVTEAMLTTSGPVTVLRLERWWVIHAPVDWFGEYADRLNELFGRIVSFPQGGRNSSRAEIVLTAFASTIVTASADGVRWVKGDADPADPICEWVRQHSTVGRMIAFCWE